MEKIIEHSDINKYIKSFVTSKQGNLSFLLTSNHGVNEVKVSVQGKSDNETVGKMFATFFASMPEIIPIFKHSIVYAELMLEEQKVDKKKDELVETMTGALLM